MLFFSTKVMQAYAKNGFSPPFYPLSLGIRLCKEKGGKAIPQGCYCPYTKSFINPLRQFCLNKTLGQLGGGFGYPNSVDCSLPVRSPDSYEAIPESILCSNPAKYICDTINTMQRQEEMQAGKKIKSYAENYAEAFQKSETDKSVKTIIHKYNPFAKSCVELSTEGMEECYTKTTEVLLSTPEGIRQSKEKKELFKKAQEVYIKFLQKKIKNTPDIGSKKILKKMVKTIEATKFILTIDKKIYAGPAFNFSRSKGGITLGKQLFGKNKKALMIMFWHEFSHVIAASNLKLEDTGEAKALFLKNFSEKSYPFYKQKQCLKKSQSASAKSPDKKCLENYVKNWPKDISSKDKLKTFREESRKGIIKLLSNLRRLVLNGTMSPDSDAYRILQKFIPNKDSCGISQIEEAMADWFSVEIVAEQYLKEDLIHSKKGTSNQGNEKIINLFERLKLTNLHTSLSPYCTFYINEVSQKSVKYRNVHDPHSSMENRFNSIFFAHPKFKKAIGCEAKIKNKKLYCANK